LGRIDFQVSPVTRSAQPVPILKPDAPSLDAAADALRRGELIGLPTETVYGLAGDARSPQALAKIFSVKRRPTFDPLILHVTGVEALEAWVLQTPQQARALAEHFWPGPLTLVLPKKASVPDLATSGLPHVAIRCPQHPVALSLLKACGFPLAAPSANPFGGLSPTRPEHVSNAFRADEVFGVLDGGPCQVGLESTILAFPEGDEGEPICLRPGGLAIETLAEFLGRPITLVGQGTISKFVLDSDLGSSPRPQAPGALPWHYAPRTPLRLQVSSSEGDSSGKRGDGKHLGYLAFSRIPDGEWGAIEILSPDGNMQVAATRLFSALHTLDAKGFQGLVADVVPEIGLGLAINDRLRKAAAAPPDRN
jgi:L-threonylcarbamoyladenylate synthase